MSMTIKEFFRKLTDKVLPNVKYLGQSRFRRCKCCQKYSLFVSLSIGDEYKLCIRCGANLRYEMLASCIRHRYADLSKLTVVEFDPASPLRSQFEQAGRYIRTYYNRSHEKGVLRSDGASCEDITALSFRSESVDLMVSSDVLEHVPDIHKAFLETARVLRTGGAHVFTVPTSEVTRKRAEMVGGVVEHLLAPEYHSDPLDPEGILVFWDFGLDAPSVFETDHLDISIVAGPEGKDGRIVWEARKR